MQVLLIREYESSQAAHRLLPEQAKQLDTLQFKHCIPFREGERLPLQDRQIDVILS
jgi:hypothetical protein